MKPTVETLVLDYIAELGARREQVLTDADFLVGDSSRINMALALREAAILAEVIGELRAMVEDEQ